MGDDDEALSRLIRELAAAPERPLEPAVGVGARVGRYRLVERIGRGGFGVVFEAVDEELGRKVAVKLMHRERVADARLSERFRREAAVVAQLSHENVVTLHDYGTVDGVPYLVLERLRGRTLEERLAAGPMAPAETLAVARAVARGLDAAHRAGVVHRDLKPSNVFLTDGGAVKVLDFGLARADTVAGDAGALVAQGDFTLSGAGTPAYMAPEQWRGLVATPATDVFAVGVILFRALAGTLPFPIVDGKPSVLAAAAAPSLAAAELPRGLADVVARALQQDPAARYADAGALVAALAAVPDGVPAAPSSSWLRRGAVAAAVVLVAGGAALVRLGPRAPTPPVVDEEPVRVTFADGCERFPAFSADGKTVVYDGEADGDNELFALDLASATSRRLTFDAGADYAPRLAPDGRRLAWVHEGDGTRQLMVRDLDGGERRSLGPIAGNPRWRRDGALLAAAGDRLIAWAPDGGARAVGRFPAGAIPTDLALFDDGEPIASWRPSDGVGYYVVSHIGAGGPGRVLVPKLPMNGGTLAASPAGDKLYFYRPARGDGAELWWMARRGGEPAALPGLAAHRTFDVARDGRMLVYSLCYGGTGMWSAGADGVARPLWSRGARGSDIKEHAPRAVDASRILYVSDRAGPSQLFVSDGAGLAPRPIAAGESWDPRPSPDGTHVVYSVRDHGLRIAALDGTMRALTGEPSDREPHLTRDGTRIAFLRDTPQGRRLFVMPAAGGEPRAVGKAGAQHLALSAADDRAFVLDTDGVVALDLDGAHGTPLPRLTGRYDAIRVSRDGRRLLLYNAAAVFEAPSDGSAAPRVVFRSRATHLLRDADFSFDGERYLLELASQQGDLWLVRGRF